MKPRNTVVSVGRELAEIKIYTLRSREGYRSFQCCWYELGKRQAKTFGHLRAAKLFAQQKTVALANGLTEILAVAPARLIPLLAIGAFSGIRSAEISRLEWQDVLWDRGYIEVKARKAKTKSRRLVPLKENLKRWLEPFRKESGQISEVECSSTGLNSLGDAAGFKWRQNALRHSYASYRLAEIQSAAQVALELGNSPEKLFAHYRELVTPEAASEWFQIFPPEGWEPKKEVPLRHRLRPL